MISGAVLTKNVIASWDEGATGWTGACGGAAGVAGAQIQLFGTGNILADPDFLNTPDILDYGGIGSGTYQIPAGHEINIGRAAPCMVLVSWGSLGQVVGSNILKVADFLAMADVLGYSASANTNVYPEIQVAQGDHAWGPWQKFSPGQYSAQYFRARMQLQTADPATTAILQSFVFSVDVPDRVDHYNALAVPAAGASLAFQPDGAASPAPFNGGNGGQTVPNVKVTILGAQQGDTVSLTAVTTGGCTIHILNGGVGVARTVNVVAQGW